MADQRERSKVQELVFVPSCVARSRTEATEQRTLDANLHLVLMKEEICKYIRRNKTGFLEPVVYLHMCWLEICIYQHLIWTLVITCRKSELPMAPKLSSLLSSQISNGTFCFRFLRRAKTPRGQCRRQREESQSLEPCTQI
jgi:hypothetical protein